MDKEECIGPRAELRWMLRLPRSGLGGWMDDGVAKLCWSINERGLPPLYIIPESDPLRKYFTVILHHHATKKPEPTTNQEETREAMRGNWSG